MQPQRKFADRSASERGSAMSGAGLSHTAQWDSSPSHRCSGISTPFRRARRLTAAKGPRGTVVESYDKVWLLTIEAKGWRPSGGERINEIGPLPVVAGRGYAVQYMEATFDPGMTAPSHEHPGPEAWHTLTGETCLETPDGAFIGRAGGPPVIVPGGPPMHLTATGTEQRRSLVLILHDAAHNPTTPRRDFVPKGLCK